MSIELLANICVTLGHGTLARIIAVGVPWLLLMAAIATGLWWHRRRGASQRHHAETAAWPKRRPSVPVVGAMIALVMAAMIAAAPP